MTQRLIDSGRDLYPAYQRFRRMERRFSDYLQPTQVEGANRLLTYLFRGGQPRALLEDGTGVGKTMQMLSTAWTISRYRDVPSLMVTKNAYLAKAMQQEASTTDIKSKRIHFATYAELPSLQLHNYGFVGLDEAHELFAHPRLIPHVTNFQGPVLLASATAFSSPELAVGFRAILDKTDNTTAAERLNLQLSAGEATPLGTWGDVCTSIANFRQTCMRHGGLIKRDLVFNGEAHIVEEPGVRGDSTRLVEQLYALYQGEKHLGRSTVLYLPPHPSRALQKMSSLLEHMQVDYATLDTVDRFRRNGTDLVLLESGRDAEGIRLHDRNGDHPRTVIVPEPCEGGELRQIEGRVSRRNAMSPSRLLMVIDPESPQDRRRMDALRVQADYFRATQSTVPALVSVVEDMALQHDVEPDCLVLA